MPSHLETPASEDHSIPPIPEVVLKFRKVINKFKREIWKYTDAEEHYGKKKAQDTGMINECIKKIQQLANILNAILNDPKHQSGDVAKVFNENGIDFSKLNDEEEHLCRHYIEIDINMFPYDVRPHHIDNFSS